MKLFEVGSTVYAARVGYKGGIEVESTKVVKSTATRLTLADRLMAFRCAKFISDPKPPPATTRRGALERLRADTEEEIENAEAHIRGARSLLADIEAALKKEQP